MKIRIYVEGGGEGKDTKRFLRQGFRAFFGSLFDEARKRKTTMDLILCGSRASAFADFKSSLEQHPDANSNLLIDSEDPVNSGPWDHLRDRQGDGWAKPDGVTDDQCHFMAQCMEAWFIADLEALKKYYGQGFKESTLPKSNDVEEVAKKQVLSSLLSATRKTKTKGEYHKTRHAPDLLKRIDPQVVQSRAPHCERLFETLGYLIAGADSANY